MMSGFHRIQKIYNIAKLFLSFSNKHSLFSSDLKSISQKYIDNQNFPKKIVFFGTDNFALTSLKALYNKQREGIVDQLHVVTSLKKPYSSVPLFCMESKIPYSNWPLDSSLSGFDIGIVVSFGHLIPQDVIQAFPLGILNVHGSLLPRWRGSSPIIHAILNGDKETGITVMNIHPHKFDVGEIIHQKKLHIEKNIKSKELTTKMAELGADCLVQCLNNVQLYINKSFVQPTTGITKAPKIKKDDSEVMWEIMTPDIISLMFLAYDDYFPLWSSWHGTQVKLRELVNWHCYDETSPHSVHKEGLSMYAYLKKLKANHRKSKIETIENCIEQCKESQKICGQIVFMKSEKVLRIYCLNGHVDFKSISIAGRKQMSAVDFNNGFISKAKYTKQYFY